MQLRFVDADQGDAVVSIKLDHGIGAGIVRHRQQAGQVGEAEIGDIQRIIAARAGDKVVDRIVAAAVVEDEQIVAAGTDQGVIAPATAYYIVAGATGYCFVSDAFTPDLIDISIGKAIAHIG